MPKKKSSALSVETKEYHVFDPSKVNKTVEIAEKPKPTIEDLEVVEKKGKIKKTPGKKIKKEKDEDLRPSGHGKYILIVTEKPQAAAKIASALAEDTERKINNPGGVSYYELKRNGKKIIVACAVGHLFTVHQNSKGSDYPIFDISWKPNFEVNKKDFTKKYFTVIKKLSRDASDIIVATDFDVEGEVIGYNIVRFIANRDDAKRMKFSSLTAGELQESYDNVLNTLEWGQAIAGETRHFIDWMYGINLSRALMHAIRSTGKFKIMSIGRVQGPALKLVVDKEKEITNFKSHPYWQIYITINDGKTKLELKHNKDIIKKTELEKFKDLEGKKVIAKTEKSKQLINPPHPFDLSTLQTEAYKFHGSTPAQTLAIAQKLYLNGLISYPRTSSQKIPDAMKPLEIIKKLSRVYGSLTQHATKSKPIEGSKSDPAHPAIIPTGNVEKLEDQEKKIFELIVKRFVSCFCDNAELANKKVEVVTDNLKFYTKGMEILKAGWLQVYPMKMEEKEIPDINGEVNIDNVRFEEKETQPPRRYSPASIVSELEKKNLGTKATRANIIETLYTRNYIKDRQIRATELGIRLIESLEKHSPIIIDEKLTREIEKDMDKIRDSKKDLDKKGKEVIKKAEEALKKISIDFKLKEKEIGNDLIEANQALINTEKENNKLEINCPNCTEGFLAIKYSPRFRSYFIGCSAYPNCRQTYPLPRSLIKNEAKKNCEQCNWPMLLSIKKGKRPWVFCFNPQCPGRLTKKTETENSSDDEEDEN